MKVDPMHLVAGQSISIGNRREGERLRLNGLVASFGGWNSPMQESLNSGQAGLIFKGFEFETFMVGVGELAVS
jgi:hypothetical protein